MTLTGQITGITKHGDNVSANKPFIDQYGIYKEYPRISKNGQILYYPPLVTTDSIQIDEAIGARVTAFAHISFDGWSPITARGFDYSLNSDFTPYTRISCSRGTGNYNYLLSSLACNTTYYLRAFSQNSFGTSLGNTLSFSTPFGQIVAGNMSVTSIYRNAVKVRIPIVESGGGAISANICAFPNDNYNPLEAICTTTAPTSTFPIDATLNNLNGNTDYYLRAIVDNHEYSDTTFVETHTLSDLTLYITADKTSPLTLCKDTMTVNYTAHLSGTDPNRHLYQYAWTTSYEHGESNDSTFTVHHTLVKNYIISVKAYYLQDTIRSQFQMVVSYKYIQEPTICENEFASIISIGNYNATNYPSVIWINSNNEEVGTGNQVNNLPRGEYKAIITAKNNCIFEKNAWMGKRITSCVIDAEPTLPTEKAHWENGAWHLDSVADHEGNWYAVTDIGNQCWTRQNMRVMFSPTTGESFYHELVEYSTLSYPFLQYLSYDVSQLGRLGFYYNLPAALDSILLDGCISLPDNYRGICPEGWHLPKIEDFNTLANFVARQKDSITQILPPFEFENSCLGTTIPIYDRLREECNPDLRENSFHDYTNFSGIGLQTIFWTTTSVNQTYNKVFAIETECIRKYHFATDRTAFVRCLRN